MIKRLCGCGKSFSGDTCECGRKHSRIVIRDHTEKSDATDWPLWAKLIALRNIESDIGVGDTVQRYAAKIGGEKFKKIAERLGIPCGCEKRQAQWNMLYKYV